MDGSLEPDPTGQDFRYHRAAGTRGQRVSPGSANQRQHLRRIGRSAEIYAEGVRTAEGESPVVTAGAGRTSPGRLGGNPTLRLFEGTKDCEISLRAESFVHAGGMSLCGASHDEGTFGFDGERIHIIC